MKIKSGIAAFLFAATLLSCGDNSQKETNNPTDLNMSLPSTLNGDTQTSTSPATSETINMQPLKPTDNTTTGTGKLNPPHGQPGHRCDIPDGAPLDGSPAPTTTSPNINIQPTTPTQPVTTTPSLNNQNKPADKNLKINPAHGQPGHRCDIAVGAPLDGTSSINKPVESTTQPISITPTQNNQPQPVTITTTAANQTAGSNLKLNPAHGEPGHRCDISVGAPLDGSTTAKTEVKPTANKNPLQYFQPMPNVESDKRAKIITKDAAKADSIRN